MHEIKFGLYGLQDILDYAKKAISSAEGREKLYDKARALTLFTLRRNKNSEESERLARILRRVSALAKGQGCPSQCKLLETRLDVLVGILYDNASWFEHYGQGLESLPCQTFALGLLHEAGKVPESSRLYQQIKGYVWYLAVFGLMEWSEESNKEMCVWLTPEGEEVARKLVQQEQQ